MQLGSRTSCLSLFHRFQIPWHGQSMSSQIKPCNHVKPDPTVPAQPADSATQTDSTQESIKIKSPCLAPRASAIEEQGFSEAVEA